MSQDLSRTLYSVAFSKRSFDEKNYKDLFLDFDWLVHEQECEVGFGMWERQHTTRNTDRQNDG